MPLPRHFPVFSRYDYDYNMVIIHGLLKETTQTLVMAAMIRGTAAEREALALAFPAVAADLRNRGHQEIPNPGPQTIAIEIGSLNDYS